MCGELGRLRVRPGAVGVLWARARGVSGEGLEEPSERRRMVTRAWTEGLQKR
jgi:hypothetical protein